MKLPPMESCLVKINLLKFLIKFSLAASLMGCSTNIEVNSKFCQGDGQWVSGRFDLEKRNLAGEQLFVDQETFVFAGVGVKDLSYEELLEEIGVQCSEIKTFRLTTYSTWFETILSIVPLFRFRSVLASGSYLKNEDANLMKNINEERSNVDESAAVDAPLNEEDIPDALLEDAGASTQEFSDDDFEE